MRSGCPPGPLARALAGIEALSDLTLDELEGVAAACRVVELPAGHVLCRQGDPGDAVYLVLEGEIEVVRRMLGGADHPVATLGRGSVVGELAVLGGSARSGTLRSRGPSRLALLPRAAFLGVCASCPTGRKLLRRLAIRTEQRLADVHSKLLERASEPWSVEPPAHAPPEGSRPTPLELALIGTMPFARGWLPWERQRLIAAMRTETLGARQALQPRPDALTIVVRGALRPWTVANGRGTRLPLVGPGRLALEALGPGAPDRPRVVHRAVAGALVARLPRHLLEDDELGGPLAEMVARDLAARLPTVTGLLVHHHAASEIDVARPHGEQP